MTTTKKADQTDGTFEHEGLLWKPRPDTTTTATEFLAARTLFLELSHDSRWNPWILEDRADEYQQAMGVMAQWTRAEPGHRPMTKEQLDAQMAKWEREFEARHAAEDRRCERERKQYDPEREAARLSLLEQQSRLDYELGEVEELRSGRKFPAMGPERREPQVAELDAVIVRRRIEVDRLSKIVGNPEEVVDQNGRLPSDRRATTLVLYSAHRSVEVRELRTKVPETAEAAKVATDKKVRASLRQELDTARRKLEKLLAVPYLTSEDMCSECATPAANHGWCTPPFDGPCSAWPAWAAKIREVRRMFETYVRDAEPKEPESAKPKPLAIVPSGLPIDQVIEKLTDLQAEYPNSEVRRGRANRWEIWPSSSTDG